MALGAQRYERALLMDGKGMNFIGSGQENFVK